MGYLPDLLLTLVSVSIVALHGWAGKSHFASEAMPRGATLLAIAALTAACIDLTLTWTTAQPVWATIAGLVIELASVGLFWQAILASRAARLKLAFDPALPHQVVRTGIYRYMRHPFYASYMVFWIGWALATWSLLSVVALVLMIAIYVAAARGEERKFAQSALAADYDAYRQGTGMFWPRFGRGHTSAA